MALRLLPGPLLEGVVGGVALFLAGLGQAGQAEEVPVASVLVVEADGGGEVLLGVLVALLLVGGFAPKLLLHRDRLPVGMQAAPEMLLGSERIGPHRRTGLHEGGM